MPKFEFYSSESIKLHENLNNADRNTNLPNFAISKLINKPKQHSLKFRHILLLLSGDINLKPGPCEIRFNDDKIWEPLKTCGLHLCHLNINSLLPKIDELRDITESKLDSSVMNAEVNINAYSIIRNDRHRNGGGVACYI